MDREQDVVDYLNASGIGATAFYDVPDPRPLPFVAVERTGGPREQLVIDRPTFAVQCWAATRPAAAELCDAVTDALLSMPDGQPNVLHVGIQSAFRDRDLETGTPRYQIVAEIHFIE